MRRHVGSFGKLGKADYLNKQRLRHEEDEVLESGRYCGEIEALRELRNKNIWQCSVFHTVSKGCMSLDFVMDFTYSPGRDHEPGVGRADCGIIPGSIAIMRYDIPFRTSRGHDSGAGP